MKTHDHYPQDRTTHTWSSTAQGSTAFVSVLRCGIIAILFSAALRYGLASTEAETLRRQPKPTTEVRKTNEIATSISGALEIVEDSEGREIRNKLPGRLVLWRHNGRGYDPIFEMDGLAGQHEVAEGDANNDGVEDVVVACMGKGPSRSKSGASYLVHYEDGHFVSKKLDSYDLDPRTIAIGDCDNDGKNGILITEGVSHLHWYRLNKDGGIVKKELASWRRMCSYVTLGDPDNDGKNEIILVSPLKNGPLAIAENNDGKLGTEYAILPDWREGLREQESKMLKKGDWTALSPEKIKERKDRYMRFHDQAKNQVHQITGYEGEMPPIIYPMVKTGVCIGGDSDRDILLVGIDMSLSGNFQVLRHSDEGYQSVYLSEKFAPGTGPFCCTYGDADNDGKCDVVLGSDRVLVLRYKNGGFEKIWGSEAFNVGQVGVPVSSVCVADTDGDGLNEIITSVKKRRIGDTIAERLIVWESKGNGGFYKAWESPDFPGWIEIAVGNFDGK